MLPTGSLNWTPTPVGEWLVRITAWMSFACYLWFLLGWIRKKPSFRVRQIIWTLGLTIFLIHLALSFHFYHQWSHENAFARTESVTGFGYGVFVSYAFTLLWLFDVLWFWCGEVHYLNRPKIITWLLHVFFAFMWINGTIPYALWPTRLIGIIAWLGIAIYFGIRLIRKHR